MLDGVPSDFMTTRGSWSLHSLVGSWHVQVRSNSVLLVREQELQLFEHCLRWSAARVDVLQTAGSPKGAKAGGKMEEL